ncbi:FUSC family protein [Gordonia sp. 'Campus']|uniref:FUSC family protein n=1 Tax=Gordonia sp. 'Campus' TaxID=2915824 RepID=UPI001EE3EED2|nr:FUSC family protein [Gordonia sp. 'Campus']
MLVASLAPTSRPLAYAAAARAVVAAGVIAIVGAVVGHLDAVGVAYLGAACAVAFIPPGTYRARSTALLAQLCGAVVGIAIGACTADHGMVVLLVAVAAVAGMVSGMVGGVGPHAPAFGMMLSIGVAFGQFGGSGLSPLGQASMYSIGTVIVAAATIAPWPFRRGTFERLTVAEVFDAAAVTCDHPRSSRARAALAAASAAAQITGRDSVARRVAYAAAAVHADGTPAPGTVVDALRQQADRLRRGDPTPVDIAWTPGTPALRAMAAALDPTAVPDHQPGGRAAGALARSLVSAEALMNGLRIALCMAAATAVAATLHEASHAFWLPLTVAVIVRPEYATVMTRTVNRLAGTLAGALLAALVLAIWPSGLSVAAVAAAALGFAVLTAPRSYALDVVGVTVSALLASSIGGPDPVGPELRLVDTVIGAAVAVLVGHLLWPDSWRLPRAARINDCVTAAHAYLLEASRPSELRAHWIRRGDDAYRLAHRAREACTALLAEPPPVGRLAEDALPRAVEVEEIVDAITAVAVAVDAGEDGTGRSERLRAQLNALLAPDPPADPLSRKASDDHGRHPLHD